MKKTWRDRYWKASVRESFSGKNGVVIKMCVGRWQRDLKSFIKDDMSFNPWEGLIQARGRRGRRKERVVIHMFEIQ